MLVVCAGPQKSGTGYLYNLVNDLVATSGGVDARAVDSLQALARFHNNNIADLGWSTLLRLRRLSRHHGTFAVKTHRRAGIPARMLAAVDIIRTVCMLRDPRDIVLSALDHGREIRAAGSRHTFGRCVTVEDAVADAAQWLQVWSSYCALPRTLFVHYEELVSKPVDSVRRIETHLGINVDGSRRRELLWRYSRDNPAREGRGLHFNRAIPYRHRTEMTSRDRQLCDRVLAPYLSEMGYHI